MPTVQIFRVPTDYTTLSVEVENFRCELLIKELKTGNLLVVVASVDCGSMQQDLGWSTDSFDHGTALAITQAAVCGYYFDRNWKFFYSQTTTDISGGGQYLVTFTFLKY